MLGNKRYCYPLTISDYRSRYLLACEGLESTKSNFAFSVFERAFRDFGLPHAVRGDNRSPLPAPVRCSACPGSPCGTTQRRNDCYGGKYTKKLSPPCSYVVMASFYRAHLFIVTRLSVCIYTNFPHSPGKHGYRRCLLVLRCGKPAQEIIPLPSKTGLRSRTAFRSAGLRAPPA